MHQLLVKLHVQFVQKKTDKVMQKRGLHEVPPKL